MGAQGEGPKITDEPKETKTELEEKAVKEILRRYGSLRLKSDNPYDILDAYNLEMNLPEIGK